MNTHPHSTEPLGLTSILVGSLPLTLLTDAAPERYVVEAVFTRRVEPEEAALILGPGTHDTLAAHGYPHVQLTVSDRRLVIANTNLEELRDRLAGEIATLLVTISTQVRALHQRQDARREQESLQLQERTRAITELTSSINFEPTGVDPTARAENDRRAAARWDTDGGALRD